MNTLLIDFIREFFMRLSKKSPKFFRIINGVMLATALITGIPGLLEELNVVLPDWAEFLQNRLIAIASTTGFIIGKLTTQSTPVAVRGGGDVLKKTDEEKMPFTAKDEAKEAIKVGGVLNPQTEKANEVVTVKTENNGK